MGKTFKKEKSYKPKGGSLNNHRDLPDYQDYDLPDDDIIDTEEDYQPGINDASTIRPEKQSSLKKEIR